MAGSTLCRIGHLLGLAAVSLALTIPAAADARTDGPVASAAFFPSGISVTVPGGGWATASSPTMPPKAKEITVTTAPASPSDADVFDLLSQMFAGPETGKLSARAKVGVCVFLTTNFVIPAIEPNESVDASGVSQLFLNLCVQMAILSSVRGKATAAAARPCPQVGASVPIKITGGKGRYRATVTGSARRARSRGLKVTCHRQGTAMVMKVRTRSRKRTLRQVVGNRILIGFASPAGTSRGVRVRVVFSHPK